MSQKRHNAAVQQAKQLIKDGKYVTDTDWSAAQPSTDEENKFLDEHGYEEFSKWYLARDPEDSEGTKGRQGFPYGDFEKVHRSGVIAAKQRAAQNDYSDIEKAADELLSMIDEREED